jgi:2-aminobenzoate-CoA ligase
MYGNVPERFIPETNTERSFGNPRIDYVFNNDELNATVEILERQVERGRGDDTAIVAVDEDAEYTYGDLQADVERFAASLLDLGVEPGDRVLLRFGEVPEAFVAQHAVWRIGAVAVPAGLPEGAAELEYFIEDTEPTALVTQSADFEAVSAALDATDHVREVVVAGDGDDGYHDFASLVSGEDRHEEFHSTRPSDLAIIYYTGGTTGKPKGTLHSHAELVIEGDLEGVEGRDYGDGDLTFTPAPLGHAFGNLEKMVICHRSGTPMVYARRPSPAEMLEIIEEHGVTVFLGAPTMVRMMLNQTDVADYDLSALRLMACSGEKLDQETYDRWSDVTDVPTYDGFGMAPMTGWFMTPIRDGEIEMPAKSVGKPYAGYEAKVVDITDPETQVGRNEVGQLAVRGPTGITYWNNVHPEMPEKMEQDSVDGWSLLDDAFRRDEDGHLYFESRLDNMITTGGRQIAATEVEDALNTHPDVAESAVVGKPHDTRGEIVMAYVVLADGVTPGDADASDLQDYVKERIAKYKYPREIAFREELPKDNVGKVQRAELREQAGER